MSTRSRRPSLTTEPQEFIGPLGTPSLQPPAALLTPPVSVPSGQQVAWALPQQPVRSELGVGYLVHCCGTGPAYTSAIASASDGGSMSNSSGCPLGLGIRRATWNGFNLPNLPADAVINAIYPVLYTQCLSAPGSEHRLFLEAYERFGVGRDDWRTKRPTRERWGR